MAGQAPANQHDGGDLLPMWRLWEAPGKMPKPAEPQKAPLGIVRSYDDLIEVCRARLVDLDVTYATLDYLAGVQDGYSAKLLGPNPQKHLGMSFPAILGALGLKLVAVEDPAAMARIRSRLEPCKRHIRNWRSRYAAA